MGFFELLCRFKIFSKKEVGQKKKKAFLSGSPESHGEKAMAERQRGDTWGTSGSLCRRQGGAPREDTFPAGPQRRSHFPPVPWARSWAAVSGFAWVCRTLSAAARSRGLMKRSKGTRGLCGDRAHRERPSRRRLWAVFASVCLSFAPCSPSLLSLYHLHSRMPSPQLCPAPSCPPF